MKTFLSALRLLIVLTVLTGVAYPLAVWSFGQVFFRDLADGSLVEQNGRIVGSALLAQKTSNPLYFQARPSAGDYATVASGASNQSWTSAKRRDAAAAQQTQFRQQNDLQEEVLPSDAITTSGGGLDPDISAENARLQTGRIVRARRLDATQAARLQELVARHTAGGQFSPSRVNVLRLNLALDTAFPSL
jgi:K+-transporting ATPase ATPase C chain